MNAFPARNHRHGLLAVAAVSAALLVSLTACGSSSTSPSSAAPTGAPNSSAAPAVVTDAAAIALLPAAVRDSGKLVVGTNLTYSPDEFKDPNGEPTGWGIELVEALAARLGLSADLRDAQFDNIIPGVKGGKYNVGWASFTDTVERQGSVDFVDYFSAGIQWASQAGKTVDPDNACGLKVAVGTGTWQETDELPAKTKACLDAGKPAIDVLKLDTQGDITNAVVLGRADAMTADSPVTQYAVSQTGGKLELAGPISEAAPFGVALPKDGSMTKAIQAAMQSLMDDGTYLEILTRWGVEDGAITTATINGGQN